MPPLKLLTSAILGRMLEKIELLAEDINTNNEIKTKPEVTEIKIIGDDVGIYTISNESFSAEINSVKDSEDRVSKDFFKKKFYSVKQLYKNKIDLA